MLTVTLLYKSKLFKKQSLDDDLERVGTAIRILVAEAANAPGAQLKKAAVDFIPIETPHSAHIPDLRIIIEAVGTPEKVERLGNLDAMLELKRGIIAIPDFSKFDPDIKLVWVRFYQGPCV